MTYKLIASTVAGLALSLPLLSHSATVPTVSTNKKTPAVYITGTIQEGDYQAALAKAREVAKSGAQVDFVLDSAGGNVVEAMKIGELVNKLHARTLIWGRDLNEEPKNATKCFSSCFLIFLAGRERMPVDNYKYGASIEKTPVLGVHRPFIKPAANKKIDISDSEAAYARIESMVRDYMRRFGAPSDLIDSMFTIPSDDVRFITKDEFKSRFGYQRPYFNEWAKAKCGALTPAEVSDFAAVLAARISSGNDKDVPEGMSLGYAEFLVKKNNEVQSCVNQAVLKHQQTVLDSKN